MWNIIKFLEIYYNKEPSQSITIDNNNSYYKEQLIILTIITTVLIISVSVYVLLLIKFKNKRK